VVVAVVAAAAAAVVVVVVVVVVIHVVVYHEALTDCLYYSNCSNRHTRQMHLDESRNTR
jgi:hypothetical protein